MCESRESLQPARAVIEHLKKNNYRTLLGREMYVDLNKKEKFFGKKRYSKLEDIERHLSFFPHENAFSSATDLDVKLPPTPYKPDIISIKG